jgi:hypothetical protein
VTHDPAGMTGRPPEGAYHGIRIAMGEAAIVERIASMRSDPDSIEVDHG